MQKHRFFTNTYPKQPIRFHSTFISLPLIGHNHCSRVHSNMILPPQPVWDQESLYLEARGTLMPPIREGLTPLILTVDGLVRDGDCLKHMTHWVNTLLDDSLFALMGVSSLIIDPICVTNLVEGCHTGVRDRGRGMLPYTTYLEHNYFT